MARLPKTTNRQSQMKKNSLFYYILIIFTVASTFVGCNRKTVFAQYAHTPINGWERNDTLNFMFKPSESIPLHGVKDSILNFQECVELRINSSYPFRSLYLVVEQTILPAGIKKSYSLPCFLVNKRGLFNGRGVNFYQYHFHLTDMRLHRDDSVSIRIRHNMKREILPGISDIGIRIEKKTE